ncbi:MAG: hypothetical protein KME15_17975 [Drouetiella hepatica Uher 2000/2452]|jgi:hypothetical protein|uniref:Uncharacterized protein n=1 Tax=Drouetiella hepatica Uher 2000/2452 TaxID=904376 RepID=A0A951UQL8_9CYAN|nr:hypothetical protein [Drouetiella hepatica Uher 2000/2452]
MNNAQYGLPFTHSEVWLSQSGAAYRADAQRPPAEPCVNSPVHIIQNSYRHEQAIEVEVIEVEALQTEAVEMQAIEMQRIVHEVQPVQSNSAQSSVQPIPAQDPNPGLLDIGFWLNLPE